MAKQHSASVPESAPMEPRVPQQRNGAVNDGTKGYAAKRAYILRHLPSSQVGAFQSQVAETAAVACETGNLAPVRELIENWEATAEIYAVPGEAEKIVEYIEEAEATREARREQGEWDWQSERQTFLGSLSSNGTHSSA